MNKIEKLIYDSVKSVPWLKYLVRNIYQSLFDLLPRKAEYFIHPADCREGYFFGFHDITPFSLKGDKLLANQLKIPLRMPTREDELSVGYFHIEEGKLSEYIKIGESYAWNYHKGCRLQWMDEERVIFNSAVRDKLIAKIKNIKSGEENIIDYPIDSLSLDSKFASSFSYERLEELMPGYGYPYEDNSFLDENAPEKTGLYLIDLEKNQRELLVSLKSLISDNDDPLGAYKHYITHTEFSHDDRFISFLHRWTNRDKRERFTKLVLFDRKTRKHFPIATDLMVSHYVWNAQNQIVAYCRINGTDGHYLIDIPKMEEGIKPIASSVLNSDGHQSFVNDHVFITDTYPDRFRISKLYSVSIAKDEAKLLASVYSPKKYQTKDFKKHIACDLHPRVSPRRDMICFDAVRNNQRSICIMPYNL